MLSNLYSSAWVNSNSAFGGSQVHVFRVSVDFASLTFLTERRPRPRQVKAHTSIKTRAVGTNPGVASGYLAAFSFFTLFVLFRPSYFH